MDWASVGLLLLPAAITRNKRADPDVWYCAIRLPCTQPFTWDTEWRNAYIAGKIDPIILTLDESDLAICDPQGWVDSGLVAVVPRDVAAAVSVNTLVDLPEPGEVEASQAARAYADEHGIDLAAVALAKGGGKVTMPDIEEFIEDGDDG